MNISIIYPNISKLLRYGSKIGASGGTQQPLGIAYLGAYLKSKGYNVILIDAETQGLSNQQILQRCNAFHTDIYCISATTIVFYKAVELARYLKAQTPSIPIIAGGPHISCSPISSMEYGCFDVCVFGEGEITLYEIVHALENGRGLSDIDGIVYREGDRVIKNAGRLMIKDLDTLPFPARELLPPLSNYLPPPINYKMVPCATILTSRGCPYNCTFCDKNTFGSIYRIRTAENIIEEIKHLIHHHNIKEIAFVDDTFNINNERLNKLFALMKSNNINLPWTCMARINTASYEQLKAMKQANCWHISFGIESGSQDIINIIKKGIDLDHARKVIKWCKEIGLQTKGFFMIGHPGETKQSIQETIDFGLSIPLTNIVVTINTPFPGSWNYDNAKTYGSMPDIDWSIYNMWTPVFVPNGLSEAYLKEKHGEFIKRFYFRISTIFNQLIQFRRFSDIKRFKSMFISAKALIGM
jgi:radical SAM superfamily enzyme YgiQ (UPF0313 family)